MSGRVFRRDVGRLLRVRKAWIIVLGVLITPALYAWLNIAAFWDPYGNTSHIGVAVANLDRGATSDLTGAIDVGTQVVEQLQDNDQLGWRFMDADAALEAVRSSEVYAAIIIPEDFSADLLSITTGTFTQPALQYYVNEKASAVAPKMTDVGASTLDTRITTSFVEQVAEAATAAVQEAGESVELRLLNAKSDTLNAFDRATADLTEQRDGLARLQSGLVDARGTVTSARSGLTQVDRAMADVQTALAQAQDIIAEAQQETVSFTDAATSAYVQGTAALADASATAHASLTPVTEALHESNARVDAALTDISAVVEANGAAIDRLQELVDDSSLDPDVRQRLTEVIAVLQERTTTAEALVGELTSLNGHLEGALTGVQDSLDALDRATSGASTAASGLRTVLTDTVPALNQAMSALSASAAAFSSALDTQRVQLAQASTLLDGLDAQLASTGDALASLDGNLARIASGLETARTDVLAIGSASDWSLLTTLTGLDPAQIASFISSPVSVAEHVVFPVATYGSAMAALFTNLALWIGAFVLVVLFRTEVDTEGVEGITVRGAYLGRFWLFAVMAAIQALIVTTGDLVLGVQTVNAPAFVATGVLIGLTYISIIYALSIALGLIGRGLCILLVIMQIPGASGLYPIEMMPGFFRALYPFLPFTYGIDAMRETIAGFYQDHYWRFLGSLLVFVVLAFVLGLVGRTRLSNLHRVFNREIAATGLLIGQEIQVTAGRYRLPDLIHALSDLQEFRADLTARATTFTARYPKLLRTTVLAGVAGLVVLGVVAWALPGGKATLLGIWVLWCLLVIGTLVALEYVQQSFVLAEEVAELDDAHLRRAMLDDGPRRRVPEPDPEPDGGDAA